MQITKESLLFPTQEFGLSAALISYGYSLEFLDNHSPRIEFVFKRDTGIEKIAENFWKGTLMVNAVAYYNAFKLLKARLHNEKKNF